MILALLLGCAPEPAAAATGQRPALAGCVVDQVVDVAMDGRADWRWRTFYDGEGHEVRTEGDQGNTGRTQSLMLYTYDRQGRLLRRAWDANADGEPEIVTTHVYDDVRELRETEDLNGDDVPEVVTLKHYRGAELEQEDIIRRDPNRPGATVRYAYDDAGNRAVRVETRVGDSSPSSIRTWTFDRAGNAVIEATDGEITGHPQVVQRTRYDVQGRPLEARWDTDGDERTNNFAFWSYDCPGHHAPTSTPSM